MKNLILAAFVASLLMTLNSHGTGIPVIDVSQIAQDASNQIQNFTQVAVNEIKNYAQGALQVTNQITQIENQILELERLGNPQTYINLLNLGEFAQTVTSLETGIGQTISGFRAIETGAMALSYTGNGLYSDLTGMVDRFGNPVAFNTVDFTKFSVVNGSVQSYMTQQATFNTQMQSLQSQLQVAIQKLNSAPDLISAVKYHALISSLHGQISALTANSVLNGQATMVQQAANQNDAARTTEARRQQEIQGRQTDLSMEATGFGQLIGWNGSGNGGLLP
jgi:hypothetical protein